LILAGDLANKVNITITAKSGGIVGQAEAARMAIAKALVDFSKNHELKNAYMQYDRNMLVYDPRRNDPHHGSGRGASKRGSRRHKQRIKR
jgi:small subunit ribosomal protein S9